MSYRTRPCPHCEVIPDETDDPMGALEACLRESVRRAADTTVLYHRIGLVKYRPGAVFWYLPLARWCRVTAVEALPFGVNDPEIGIPIEYPADDPNDGMVPTIVFPDDLADWDPTDPRLPESELREAREWKADLEDGRRRFAEFAAAEELRKQLDGDRLLNSDTGETPR